MKTGFAIIVGTAAIVAAVALVGTRAYADDAADIEAYAVNAYSQYDNYAGDYPVITAIMSAPGTYGGHTYTGWSVLAQDASGSIDLFISAATLTTLTGNASATLAVGDKLSVAGQWSPYHQIPEIAFSTVPASNNYFNIISHNNGNPGPLIQTVSQVNPGTIGLPSPAGYWVEIQNVMVSGSTGSFQSTFPNYAQANIASETYTITDNTGSMTFFDWVTSYSTEGALAGQTVWGHLDGPTTVYGFISSYNGVAEFTGVPEPSTIALAVGGLLGLLALRRRRS
jgi:hypothetical protein